MQFTFDKDAMSKAISVAMEMITVRSAGSVLSGVLLETADGSLVIKASDSSASLITHISVDIREEGSVIVSCERLMGILQSLPSGDVDFATTQTGEAESAVIKPVSRKVTFSLRCMSADKFPPLPSSQGVMRFDLAAKEFKDMIMHTSFAVSGDVNRYFMTGVYFALENNNLVMAATDGRRLALMSGDGSFLEDTGILSNSIIIPTKILLSILRNVPNEGNVTIAINDKVMFVISGSYEFSTQLIDGKYPDYHKVIPESHTNTFKVLKSDLEGALKRMMIMIDKRSSRLIFRITDSTLTIQAPENEAGEADEEISCESDVTAEVTMALNCHFILEPLKVIDDGDKVIVEFSDPMKAIILKSEKNTACFNVIMPMNLS